MNPHSDAGFSCTPSIIQGKGSDPSGPTLLWGREALAAAAPTGTTWIWHGYLASAAVTLLTSQWKAGKTTLTSVLLARMKAGGNLAGLPVAAGRAVVVSEEAPEHWHRRARTLDFGDHVGWYCRPFRDRPRTADWLSLIDRIAEAHALRPLSLVVIDPLAAFLPAGSENDATCVLAALLPLQRLTGIGLSVLVLHHPRKGRVRSGQAARGSGALSGYADILIEMRWYANPADVDRRRRLSAFSRFEETPSESVIELTADGMDYHCVGTLEDAHFADAWTQMLPALEQADRKLTRGEIRARWPDSPAPDMRTLNRWLNRAEANGMLLRDGQGIKGSPYRYWLLSREAVWLSDPRAVFRMPELMHQKEQQMNADEHR
jgi:hypothetical protein